MKIPKEGILLTAVTFAFLSMLIVAWAGGFWRNQTSAEDDEDWLIKGYRLSLEQRFEEAYGCFRVAWMLAATIDDNPQRAMQALKGMGNCAFWMGEVDSCIYRYNQAVVLARELNKPYDEYEIYSQLKLVYMTKVDMESVLRMTQKIDSLTMCSPDKRIRIGLNQRLAMEAMQQGSPKLAEHYWLANETLLDSLSEGERPSEQFIVYGNLRDFYFNMQDYNLAKKNSHLYIEVAKKNMRQRQMGYMAYDGEALICAQQKDRKAAFNALDSMKYGLTLKEDANQTNAMHYHEVKGRVHAILGEWDKACDEFKKGLEAAEGTKIIGRTSYYQLVRLWGNALFQLKKYDEARKCYRLCWEYCKYQYGEESMSCADVLLALASLEEQCGEKEAGKMYYMTAIDNCKKIVNEQLHFISVQERNAFWTMFAPSMFAMSAYALKMGETQSLFTDKCYEALFFSKALLLESDRTMAMAISTECTPEEKQIYYEMMGLQNQLKGMTNDYEKNKERIEKLHERISKLNQQLTPIISNLGYTSFLTLGYQDVKQSLKDDEVLLDFTDYKSDEDVQQIAIFVIDRKQDHPKLVKSFTEEGVKILLRGNPTDFLYKEPYASNAVNMIWKPLAKEVKGKKTIYYVPSGILHKIALESLPLSDGSLLGEHYNFVRLTSAREVVKSRKGAQKATYTTAMLYGALKYDMDTISMVHEALRYKVEPLLAYSRGEIVRGGERFKELPNAKEEIDRIKVILKSSHLKVSAQTGTEGTEESFMAMNGKAPQILHIATHGFYYNTSAEANDISYLKGYNDAMQFSGLIMAGGNRAWTGKKIPKEVEDGVLTANSIAAMNLRGTDLVVLSACKTGLGVATPEGLYGLQRAFKKAGVQTIIMSLWSVDDEAAKDFMIKFYEELADVNNKWDKRNAFEKAKSFVRSKTYIRKGKAYTGDPYFWAAFVMLD